MTLQETELELNSNLDDIEPDLSLPDEVKLVLLQKIRHQAVVDYYSLKIQIRLNDLVENMKVADQQREQAKKLVLQVNQLDKDIRAIVAEDRVDIGN